MDLDDHNPAAYLLDRLVQISSLIDFELWQMKNLPRFVSDRGMPLGLSEETQPHICVLWDGLREPLLAGIMALMIVSILHAVLVKPELRDIPTVRFVIPRVAIDLREEDFETWKNWLTFFSNSQNL